MNVFKKKTLSLRSGVIDRIHLSTYSVFRRRNTVHPSQRFRFEHKMKQKQRSRSCHIAELSGAFLLAYLEIYKLAACILKHIYL